MPYLGKEPVRGQNRELDDISGSFNGGNTAFTMQVGGVNTSAGSVNQLFISVGGVMQNPGTDFTVASSTITFTTPPASGLDFWGLIQGDAVDINTPADGSVTNAKVASGAAIALDKLASTPAVLTGSTNNTITTVTGANAIQGEANLTFDGTRLTLGTATSNASDVFTIVDPGNVFMSVRSDAQADGNNQVLDFGVGTGNRASGNIVSSIAGVIPSGATAGGTLKGYLSFSTNSGDSLTERFKITETGNVSISDGDLVIGTSGHGIDFSATSGTGTSELFDDYEVGTFTVTNVSMSAVSDAYTGRYTKIGNQVFISISQTGGTVSFSAGNAIKGLPFTISGSTVVSITNRAGNINGNGYTYQDGSDEKIYVSFAASSQTSLEFSCQYVTTA